MSSRKRLTCLCQGLLATKKASNPYLQIQSENYERVTIGRLLTLTYDRYQSKGQKPHLGVSIEKRERETPAQRQENLAIEFLVEITNPKCYEIMWLP